jgi:hypothetical protein
LFPPSSQNRLKVCFALMMARTKSWNIRRTQRFYSQPGT